MAFELSNWFRRPERRAVVNDDEALGSAVHEIVEARMTMLRATLQGRAAMLKAQSISTDSASLKTELDARVRELEFVIGQMGG